MEIWINGKARPLAEPVALERLLKSLDVETTGVAIALNEKIIPRSRFPEVTVGPGDRVEIVSPQQGG